MRMDNRIVTAKELGQQVCRMMREGQKTDNSEAQPSPRPMTVKALIERLAHFPPDAEVQFLSQHREYDVYEVWDKDPSGEGKVILA